MPTRAALIACLLWAAADAPAPAQTFVRGDLDFFEAKIRPILVNRCFSCHSSDKKTRGRLSLDNRASILRGGESGPAAVAGKPEESRLIDAIRYKDPELSMPPTGKLPEHEAALLIDWVRRGLPYPESGKKVEKAVAINMEEGKKFWSFQPVREVAPPPVKTKDWARKPIDSFLLAEMEKKGLAPSPAATRRVLIRRAYFDLIGLPPPPEEVEAFTKDERPDAYPKLVERLLASPHYGERWGRYWLDLARYCDVPEPWAEAKGQPHVYRDWVVKAFNDDLPYNQFVTKQLAADLLPDGAPEELAALGFLGLSPSYWKELKLAPDVIRMVVAEEWEERIGAVTNTFLGLTVACARCHDHKFDPITTEDYYALAGVFASTKPTERALLPAERAAEVLKAHERIRGLEEQLAKLKDAKNPSNAKAEADLKADIAGIRNDTPDYHAALVPGVDDASLHVEADGPHKTKLVYKPGAIDVAVQIRGVPANAGKIVSRRFLRVLSTGEPKAFTQGSGRLELAQTIVGDAAPLAARVMVNRVWKNHFGRGLVETPSDFGAQGERPTHPQLLDDLAARFIANGWSLKWLHREIMLSAAYQQSSTLEKKHQAVDPDNRLLWRMNRRRLDVEAWRDAMLCVSGALDRKVGGPPLDLGDAKNVRRTLYGTVKRRELHDLLRLYDFPDPTAHASHRIPTVTPLQQLFALNGPLVEQQAAALAKRLKTTGNEERIRLAYRLLFGREATEKQLRLGREFVAAGTDEAWRSYAQVLLGSNEFLFID